MTIDTFAEAERLVDDFGPRGPGTDAERRAASHLAGRLGELGREAETESFSTWPGWPLAYALHAGLAIAGSALAVDLPVAGAALALAAVLLTLLDASGVLLTTRRLFGRRASQNVVSWGDRDAPGRASARRALRHRPRRVRKRRRRAHAARRRRAAPAPADLAARPLLLVAGRRARVLPGETRGPLRHMAERDPVRPDGRAHRVGPAAPRHRAVGLPAGRERQRVRGRSRPAPGRARGPRALRRPRGPDRLAEGVRPGHARVSAPPPERAHARAHRRPQPR